MQSAETVLGVLRERGRRDLPCDELYRQLFNPQLYLLAYGRIYANKGAMTAGVTEETADGMSMRKIGRIIDAMRHERYRFHPVKRIYIPKKNGRKRPLGLPTWSDKLVGEVVRLLLESYYEPRFSGRSHGFRPGRGCHTALTEVAETWTGTTWFIEADISDCFGALDHDVMLGTLAERIHDNRFLTLVSNMLSAGYLEDWVYGLTLSGTPQGGVASPILSNIYLHKLDQFVEQVLIPENTRGERRSSHPEYRRLTNRIRRGRSHGDRTTVRAATTARRLLPSGDPQDPSYRRLRYIRYADDHLLGFTGPRAEAENIKQRLTRFLRDELKLELSQEKTLLTHARSQAARFLGYDVSAYHGHTKLSRGRRLTGGFIQLKVPRAVIKAKTTQYFRCGKPAHRRELVNHDDHTIIATYGTEYRGLVQYYLLAGNVYRFNRVEWAMSSSMLKTLAAKHHSSVVKMAARHRAHINTPRGRRTCYEAQAHRPGRTPLVARFGGIPLTRQRTAVLHDRQPVRVGHPHKEIISRLQRATCELCGSRDDIEVHQVRGLAELTRAEPGSAWAAIMTRKRRKTLVVCRVCHERIHQNTPPPLTP